MNQVLPHRCPGLAAGEPTEHSSLLRPFYPGFDGLRAIAFFLVFGFHFVRPLYNSALFQWGWVGVDLFFVLSGFLITGILYDSRVRSDFFSSFYIRRSLRIFPVFYGIWVCLLLLTPLLHIQWNRYLAVMALYLGDLFLAAGHAHLHSDPGVVLYSSWRHPGTTQGILIDHFWSLCVEEQFYLVWPATVWLLRTRTRLLTLCVLVILTAPVGRSLYEHAHPDRVAMGVLYYNSLSRVDTLLFGAALALWLRGPAPRPATLMRLAWASFIGAPLLLAILLSREVHPAALRMMDPVVCSLGYSLIGLASCGVVVLTLRTSWWFVNVMENRILRHLGQRSYGLYAYHQLFSVALGSLATRAAAHHVAFAIPVLAFSLTYAVAQLSFRFLESPFLRLKGVFAPKPETLSDPPPAA